jgi:hypothetical protein
VDSHCIGEQPVLPSVPERARRRDALEAERAGKDVTRDDVLEKEIKQHKAIKGHEIVRCIGALIPDVCRIIGLLQLLALFLLVPSAATCRKLSLAGSCRTCISRTTRMPRQIRIVRGRWDQSWTPCSGRFSPDTTFLRSSLSSKPSSRHEAAST